VDARPGQVHWVRGGGKDEDEHFSIHRRHHVRLPRPRQGAGVHHGCRHAQRRLRQGVPEGAHRRRQVRVPHIARSRHCVIATSSHRAAAFLSSPPLARRYLVIMFYPADFTFDECTARGRRIARPHARPRNVSRPQFRAGRPSARPLRAAPPSRAGDPRPARSGGLHYLRAPGQPEGPEGAPAAARGARRGPKIRTRGHSAPETWAVAAPPLAALPGAAGTAEVIPGNHP
jgi:hypothetical protein